MFNTGNSGKIPTVTSSEITANISSNVSLSCWIDNEDYCPEKLLWKFNNEPEPLPESGKKYKMELKDTHTKCKRDFLLSIFNVTENDEGIYSCHWFCDGVEKTTTAIDLKVADDLRTGKVSSMFVLSLTVTRTKPLRKLSLI